MSLKLISVTLTAFLSSLTALLENIRLYLAHLICLLIINEPQCLNDIDVLLIIFLDSDLAPYITMLRTFRQTVIDFRSCRKPMHLLSCCTAAFITSG